MVFDERPEVRELEGRDRTEAEEVDGGDRVVGELADAEGRPLAGDLGAERQVDSAPVCEGRVQDRLVDRDVLAGDLREPEDVLVEVELPLIHDVRPKGPEHPVEHVEGHARSEATDVLEEWVAQDRVGPSEPEKIPLEIVEEYRAASLGHLDIVQVKYCQEPLVHVRAKLGSLLETLPGGDGQFLLTHHRLHPGPDLTDLLLLVGLQGRFECTVLELSV